MKTRAELENMPTQPTATQKQSTNAAVQVVLKPSRAKKKEQPDNKEIENALNQAKDLARAPAAKFRNATPRRIQRQSGAESRARPGSGKAKVKQGAPGPKASLNSQREIKPDTQSNHPRPRGGAKPKRRARGSQGRVNRCPNRLTPNQNQH